MTAGRSRISGEVTETWVCAASVDFRPYWLLSPEMVMPSSATAAEVTDKSYAAV